MYFTHFATSKCSPVTCPPSLEWFNEISTLNQVKMLLLIGVIVKYHLLREYFNRFNHLHGHY